MAQANRGRVLIALLLMVAGLGWLAIQLLPAPRLLPPNENIWSLLVVGIGVVIALAAIIAWKPGLIILAAIVVGSGGFLLWQSMTGNWASWAYAWTLIPVLAGIGVFLMYLMQGNLRQAIVAGGSLMLVGLFLFLIVSSFFGAPPLLGQLWPLLLILLGIVLLARGFWQRA